LAENAYVLLWIGKSYIGQAQWEEAETHLRAGLTIASSTYVTYAIPILEALFEIFIEIGDYARIPPLLKDINENLQTVR
jgi:hypothetical protein